MKKNTAIAAGALLALAGGTVAVPQAGATSGSTSLNLKGGDKLQANAWHCGFYWSTCDWSSSAKLLGNNPSRATSITNEAAVQAHGFGGTLTVAKNPSFTITGTSSSLVRTKWTNNNSWISDSSGQAKPNHATSHISVESKASAQHSTFGSPSGVRAYAGAF